MARFLEGRLRRKMRRSLVAIAELLVVLEVVVEVVTMMITDEADHPISGLVVLSHQPLHHLKYQHLDLIWLYQARYPEW